MAEKASTRQAYGNALLELGRTNPNIVVLDADLSPSTMTCMFARDFPDRFFDCGLSEQNMISMAAGLAASGKTVFASSFAVFASSRCYDQLRICLSQTRLDVKVVATHAGITVGEDGASHQAIEDLALYCALPGFTVVVPSDAIEAAGAVKVAAATYGPFYVRLSRPATPLVHDEGYRFELGSAEVMRPGGDVTIIATGIMVAKALEAATALARDGIDTRVLNMPTLKPLDEEAIVSAAAETGAVVVAEEHLAHGGLGGRVAEVAARRRPVPMSFVNLGDVYALSGKPEELLKQYRLTEDDIYAEVHQVVQRKRAFSDTIPSQRS